MPQNNPLQSYTSVPAWQPVLFAALAGGLGWGIRGQYGHETGAMIAGVLVSLVIVFLLCPAAASLPVARAVAMGTIAMGIGGSMTYGQTLGLTQDPEMIGNWPALRWGMLGCAIKGGAWIGFAGLFLGMGLGGQRYRSREILFLVLAMLGASLLGGQILNEPFNLRTRELPAIYFSATWDLFPNKADLRPRPEYWGALWFALITAFIYAGWHRKDTLARNLALWGVLGGAIGFPLGQTLQAYHAWNPDVFKQGIWVSLDPHMNWWNWMETTFGATMGAALGLGAWRNRARIKPGAAENGHVPGAIEAITLAVHLWLLVVSHFFSESHPQIAAIYDSGLVLIVIPMTMVVGSRWWPYFMALPITLVPIAAKTLNRLAYESESIGRAAGWFVYFILPLALATAAALWFILQSEKAKSAATFAGPALLITTWTYFLLNWTFFEFPWPWAAWTSRTPNGIMFTICAFGITALVVARIIRGKAPSTQA